MEFWGVEVKAGEPTKVTPAPEHIIHLSQAALGESKNKGNENVPVFVNFGNKKLVLGTLSQEKFPQITFDLVFEKEFELSHNWKSGSVFFCGYKSALPDESMSEFGSDEEEDFPMIDAENSGLQLKSEKPKPAVKKAKIEEPSKPVKDEEEDSDEDDDSDEEGDESDEEGDSEEGDDSEEDESESEDEETQNKAPEPSKKRPNDAATKTPPPAKKAKQSPQKSDAKKNVHTATPHPAKQGGKAANGKTPNQQTPKSGGQFACKSCPKTFGSDNALQSHTKAKHA